MTRRPKPGVYPYQTTEGPRWRIKVPVTMADGSTREVNKRGFATAKAAQAARDELVHASRHGGIKEPSRQPLGEYLAKWVDGLQLSPSTVASYRKNVRLHITPHLGKVPLADLTPAHLAGLYRKLEQSGRQ